MSVARAYAKALYETVLESDQGAHAHTNNIKNLIHDQAVGFQSVIDQHKEFRIAILGPVTSQKEKISLVREVAKKFNCSQVFLNFLNLLIKKGRLYLLPEILEAFESVCLEAHGGIYGTLVSAIPVEQSLIDELVVSFKKKLGKQVEFKTTIDPSLLAGIKVTVNGVTYDGTLYSKLKRLRDKFVFGTAWH
ncbi:MAG: ATP synthase F1 subunit delta [Bdellovibrio sp.]|nr:ATP synthase F1 subunit delta [Bdellovibrio sp.]